MTDLFNINDGFTLALATLRRGGLVAVPTETVYGLAADATSERAVARIFEAKGRPAFNPLIAHVSNIAMAHRFAEFNDMARLLADRFWPGPLTLVLPLKPRAGIAPAVTAGHQTIALRHPLGVMASLAEELGSPLAAPSANSSGQLSPTLAAHVASDLAGKIDLILDNGPCEVGLESSIVKIEDDQCTLLREGGLARSTIESVAGPLQRAGSGSAIQAPGMMLAHYAPRLPVRLNAPAPGKNEAFLAFGPQDENFNAVTRNLSLTGNLNEAARNLFAMLNDLDNSGAQAIAVQFIPTDGIGAAINDRLRRAAHAANRHEAVDG